MLRIVEDVETPGHGRFILEVVKPSYPPLRYEEKPRFDQAAQDTMRVRLGEQDMLRIAFEVVACLDADALNRLVEDRLYRILRDDGLPIPYQGQAVITNSRIFIKPREEAKP